MSYILDALRRADAERERGQVPGLRSQAAPLAAAPEPRRSRPWWMPALVILLIGVLSFAAWWFWPVSAPPANLAVAPAAPAAVSVPEKSPAATTAVAAPAPAPVAPAPATQATPALPILTPKAPLPSPGGSAKKAPDNRVAAEAATAAKPPKEARVPSFGELSADVRARLPQVNVSGATYSANPALRMLIVNGQVMKEGEEIQSGLQLVSIGPRSATLDFQGTRYTIGY